MLWGNVDLSRVQAGIYSEYGVPSLTYRNRVYKDMFTRKTFQIQK